MQSDRLTRQELAWLLTQEARTAAEKLRSGVQILSMPPRDTSDLSTTMVPALDALDEAMRALSHLHSGTAPRGRRGRIDVAAIVWEIAPQARVSLEPGSGTEVLGDELELRRMLQVLIGSTSPTTGRADMSTPTVSITREGAFIRISVTLGPDSSANAEAERGWLGRMAIRYGGVFELDGANEALVLLAGDANDQRELDALRVELSAAQRQGEAYARELAAVVAQSHGEDRGNADLAALSSGMDAIAWVCRSIAWRLGGASAELDRIATGLERPPESTGPSPSAALRSLARAQLQITSTLMTVCERATGDPEADVPLGELVGAVADACATSARERGISLTRIIADGVETRLRPEVARRALRLLVDDAIAATPPGGGVQVRVESWAGPTVIIADSGAGIADGTRLALTAGIVDPATLGRPASVRVACAMGLLAQTGGSLSWLPVPIGAAARVTFPSGDDDT